MTFSDELKTKIKKRSDFTCCWCSDRDQKVEIHHILPEAEGGLDTYENAAPLCSNCHTKYGGNPDLRKEIRLRRDHWYDLCRKKNEVLWPEDMNIPLLIHSEVIKPITEKTKIHNTNLGETTNRFLMSDTFEGDETSSIKFSFIYDDYNNYHPDNLQPNCINLLIQVPFGIAFSIVVCAWSSWDVNGFINVLHGDTDLWMLSGNSVQVSNNQKSIAREQCDYLLIYRLANGENRFVASTQLPSRARVSIQARFADDVSKHLATYLVDNGFDKVFPS